jgi:hypothetical protein
MNTKSCISTVFSLIFRDSSEIAAIVQFFSMGVLCTSRTKQYRHPCANKTASAMTSRFTNAATCWIALQD